MSPFRSGLVGRGARVGVGPVPFQTSFFGRARIHQRGNHHLKAWTESAEKLIWLGDFNFEEGDGTQSDAYEKMIEAYATVCRKLGSEADGGLLDAYRIAHSDGVDTTREGRRIDRGLIDPRLVGGLPGLADADHIHQTELQVVGKGGNLRHSPPPPEANTSAFTWPPAFTIRASSLSGVSSEYRG